MSPAEPVDEQRLPWSIDPAGYNASAERFNRLGDGQPSCYCQWVPCPAGCCLGWDGHEKFYAGPARMQYLIDHFLRPDAHAQRSGDQQFSDFTFDHHLSGVVVGRRGDNRELFALRVGEDEVEVDVMCPGDPMPWDLLGYDSIAASVPLRPGRGRRRPARGR